MTKYPTQTFDLPMGFQDQSGTVHGDVEIREMTGVEQDLFAAMGEGSDVMKTMNEILVNCIQRIGSINDKEELEEVVPRLVVGDRTFIFIRLRQVTLGDVFKFKASCSRRNCEEENTLEIDLNDLEVNGREDYSDRTYTVEISGDREVVLQIPTGLELERAQKNFRNVDTSKKRLSVMMYNRIKKIGDEENVSFEDVRKMRYVDRLRVQNAINNEPGIETEIEYSCQCGSEEESMLDVTSESFFFPSDIPI